MTMSYIQSLLAVFLIAFGSGQLAADEPTTRPNVLIFFIDDLGYGDLGCYGSKFYETPQIDRLAASGVKFTDFYSANPVCSPTRVALMTGKAPQRIGITQWLSQPNEKHLPLEEVTIGEAFAGAGYRTGYIGKWHLGHSAEHAPDKQGFAWTRCVNRAGQPASYFHPFAGKRKKGGDGVDYWDVPDLKDAQPGDYLTDKMTDYSIEFLNAEDGAGSAPTVQPFFLCFSHYAVHTPIQSPKPLIKKYKQKRADRFGDSETGTTSEGSGETRLRQDNPDYAAMVENLDTNVGRVLDALEQNGQRENTIILFTSDNGGLSTRIGRRAGPTSVRPLRAGKGWTYEGGIRVPLLIATPPSMELANVKTCGKPGITMDLFPTLLDLCGLSRRPKLHLDGISLAPAMKSVDLMTRRTMAWHYPHEHGSGHKPSSAIRQGKWKLIHLHDPESYELYDLSADIGEQQNVIEIYPDVAVQLRTQMVEWLERTTPAKAEATGS